MQTLENFWRDLWYSARSLRRTPTFAIAVIVAIAVGVGAASAVFSVVDRILFRSLPYPQSGRLVSFGMLAPIAPQEFMLGYDYLDWRDTQTPFAAMGSWVAVVDCDLNDVNPVRLSCARVDPGLLATLGVAPLLGRNFTPQEDRPNAPKVALISYGLWRGRFGGDPGVVGRQVPLNGQPTTIAGVLPADFEMPSLAAADLLIPAALDEAEERSRRLAVLMYAVGRLKPGVSAEQAQAALQPLFDRSMKDVPPAFRKEVKLRVRPLKDRQIQDARRASWILLAAVLALLAIACANVANLLVARGAARQRELAVRAALGAGRGRLIGQALTESLLLAATGGAAGCGLAFLLLRLFTSIAPEGIPRLHQAAVDGRVLLFALAVSLASGALFGLAPALQRPRAETLSGWRVAGSRHHLFRQALVAIQMGVSLMLLAGASLLARSLWNLQNQPLGIHPGGLLTASVTLGRTAYADPGRRLAFFEELETRLIRIPGVKQAALASSLPPSGSADGPMLYAAIDVEGRTPFTGGTGGPVAWRAVTPGYFEALGISILRGRGFRDEDRASDQDVVILSDRLARRMFPGADPLGHRIKPGRVGAWRTVVGVAANVKNNGLVQTDDPEYYEPRKHSPRNIGRSADAVLLTAGDPGSMAGWLRAQVAALDPTLPVKIETFSQQLGRLAERPRFNAVLMGMFSTIGLLLAAVGLYGVVSFQVSERTQEIGVRMALGATPRAIAGMVLRRAARWTAAGAVLGVAGSLAALRLLQAMLFQLSAEDPWILAAALAVLVAAALLAAWIPSRRASQVDPIEALRQE